MIFTSKFEELDSDLPLKFEELDSDFSTSFGENITIEVTSEFDTYEGNYSVIPKTESQTLLTKKKVMAEDVTIKEIPYFDVSNNAGGSTVYIGSEVE